jgi:hypothetical protein
MRGDVFTALNRQAKNFAEERRGDAGKRMSADASR